MCEKKKYSSKGKAFKALLFLARTGRSEKGTYFCKGCKAWHLTKQMNKWTPIIYS